MTTVQLPTTNWLKRNTTQELYNAYKEFMTTGKYPYLQDVTDFVAEKYNIADKEQLHHEMYVASSMYRLEQMEDVEKELKDKGFTPITEFDFEVGQKVILQGDIRPLRIKKDADGKLFAMPPRMSRRGYSIEAKKYEHSAYERAKQDGRMGMRGEKVNMVKEYVS